MKLKGLSLFIFGAAIVAWMGCNDGEIELQDKGLSENFMHSLKVDDMASVNRAFAQLGLNACENKLDECIWELCVYLQSQIGFDDGTCLSLCADLDPDCETSVPCQNCVWVDELGVPEAACAEQYGTGWLPDLDQSCDTTSGDPELGYVVCCVYPGEPGCQQCAIQDPDDGQRNTAEKACSSDFGPGWVPDPDRECLIITGELTAQDEFVCCKQQEQSRCEHCAQVNLGETDYDTEAEACQFWVDPGSVPDPGGGYCDNLVPYTNDFYYTCCTTPKGQVGDFCDSNTPCDIGLKCCYPCGIQGCAYECAEPCNESDPFCHGGCMMHI